MKCTKCEQPAIYEEKKLCSKHFIEYFENKVKRTIKKFKLLEKKDKVCVAASGGKDSTALLYVLKKLGYNVEALALDEGIRGYRDRTLIFLKKFCEDNKISLRIYSYKDEVGQTIDQLSKKYKPACNVCGTFRRHLLEKYSKGCDKLATGHNLDDEAQSILMNILKAQVKLFDRQGPSTSKVEGFTQKIKPFYFLKEKEVLIYSYLLNLTTEYEECPYAPESFRAHVRDLLNEEESQNPGTKLNIVKKYLSIREQAEVKLNHCVECGLPSNGPICKACRLKKEINLNKKRNNLKIEIKPNLSTL